MKGNVKCQTCGAKMVEYRFSFNNGLASLLRLIGSKKEVNEPFEIASIEMTSSQWTNAAKLRYWGFLLPVENPENRKKMGWWKMTKFAGDFLSGEISINKHVIMYRNQIQRYEGDFINMEDLLPGYKYRMEYAEEGSPKQSENQLEMFNTKGE
jgi:hypothetical protein